MSLSLKKSLKKPSRLPERRTSPKESGLIQKTLKPGDSLKETNRPSWEKDPKRKVERVGREEKEDQNLQEAKKDVKEEKVEKAPKAKAERAEKEEKEREGEVNLPVQRLKSRELIKKMQKPKV